MHIVKTRAWARAGLVGNPSDGYFGKTISVPVRHFSAGIVLYEWPELDIILTKQDRCEFESLDELMEDVRLHGYYGGLRLVKAAIKKFGEYCRNSSIKLDDKNFCIRYDTTVPRQVGQAGSSAIITATMKALFEYYRLAIKKPELANLILAVETDELGITAGLQDRVCQVYGQLVYMDFGAEHFARQGYGVYEPMDEALLPPLYLAYNTNLAETSDVVHNNIRERFDRGEQAVVDAMRKLAELTDRGKAALLAGEHGEFGRIMDENFDTRMSIYNVSRRNIQMVETARSIGASAKLAGSGGSVVGVYTDENMFRRLAEAFAKIDCRVLKIPGPPPLDGD